jgi:hypothetical protein
MVMCHRHFLLLRLSGLFQAAFPLVIDFFAAVQGSAKPNIAILAVSGFHGGKLFSAEP